MQDGITQLQQKGSQLIVCIDANIQLSNEGTLATGGWSGVKSSPGATAFATWASNIGIFLPSTYADASGEAASRQLGTYQPTRACEEVRIDYIGLSNDFTVREGSACVNTFIELGCSECDHSPTQVVAKLTVVDGILAWKRRKLPYDRKLIRDPKRIEDFAAYMNRRSSIDAAVEPSSHQHILDTYVLCGLVSHFTSDCPEQRQDYLSGEAFQLVIYILGNYLMCAQKSQEECAWPACILCFISGLSVDGRGAKGPLHGTS